MSLIAPELLAAYRQEVGPAARILARVAERHGMTVTDIKSPSRKVKVVLARQNAAYEIIKLRKSLGEVGRILGGRDHSTIHHAVRVWPAKAAKLGVPVDLEAAQ